MHYESMYRPRLRAPFLSVAQHLIDQVQQRLAKDVPQHVLVDEKFGGLVHERGRLVHVVRAQQHVVEVPQRAPRRERLCGEHAQRRPPQPDLPERRDQRVLVHHRPLSQVDEHEAPLGRRERRHVHHPLGLQGGGALHTT